jgi:hypothetical protein
MDAAVTMLITSRPLVIAQLLFSLLFGLLCCWASPGAWSAILLTSCLAIVAGYTIYTIVGVALLGIRFERLGRLLCVPFAVAGYLLVALKSLLRGTRAGRGRTPRIDRTR